MTLTRESLKAGVLREMLAAEPALTHVLTDQQIIDSLHQALAAAPADVKAGADAWVFGYGSLIWNPAFHYQEQRISTLDGYHREFCLWTHLGRGSPDNPGLVLGLEDGGRCCGMLFRVAADQIEEEFSIIWQREMVSGAYRPLWVPIRARDGAEVTAVTFVINRDHPRYAADLPDETIVRAIATACGKIGQCSDYLINTIDHLEQLGIEDAKLRRLADAVMAMMRRSGRRSGTPPADSV